MWFYKFVDFLKKDIFVATSIAEGHFIRVPQD